MNAKKPVPPESNEEAVARLALVGGGVMLAIGAVLYVMHRVEAELGTGAASGEGVLAWVLLGVGAALTVTGVVLTMRARSKTDSTRVSRRPSDRRGR